MEQLENTDLMGSDQMSDADVADHNKLYDSQLKHLHEAATRSDEARKFLNTSFGSSLRETIATNKILALETCAKAKDQELSDAQFEYAVWEKTEQVFAIIIQGGDSALQELNQLEMH